MISQYNFSRQLQEVITLITHNDTYPLVILSLALVVRELLTTIASSITSLIAPSPCLASHFTLSAGGIRPISVEREARLPVPLVMLHSRLLQGMEVVLALTMDRLLHIWVVNGLAATSKEHLLGSGHRGRVLVVVSLSWGLW